MASVKSYFAPHPDNNIAALKGYSFSDYASESIYLLVLLISYSGD